MDNTGKLIKILTSHNLRKTECRKSVLDSFLKSPAALSQGDLESRLTEFDRVTIYRTLNSFLDAGIIHQIPNSQGAATYGLCHETCGPDHHSHNHIHFKCNKCGQIECLDDKSIPAVTLPEGYLVNGVNMIVDGICIKCA